MNNCLRNDTQDNQARNDYEQEHSQYWANCFPSLSIIFFLMSQPSFLRSEILAASLMQPYLLSASIGVSLRPASRCRKIRCVCVGFFFIGSLKYVSAFVGNAYDNLAPVFLTTAAGDELHGE